MKILVTGANGFLAVNTILFLLEKGYQVIGTLRHKNKTALPEHPGLELIESDLIDLELMEAKIGECFAIVHIAAETRQNITCFDEYYKVNYLITKNLLQTAIKCRLKKFIYVSTVNTIGYGSIDRPGSENDEIKEPFSKSVYALSKLSAQKLVLSNADKIDAIALNPSFMIGPYDSRPSSGRIIFMGYKKRVVFYPPGGKNFVNVKDVAEGILAALDKGRAGESYLLTGENLTYKEFFQKLSEITHSRAVLIKIPNYILLLSGLLGNLLRFTGVKNSISLTNMKILCVRNYYTNKKAREELGISFKSIDTSILEACNWFRQSQMLKK